MTLKIDTKGEQRRSYSLEQGSVDEEQRTVEIAFSSEAPYRRAFGDEVLDHSADSVRLSRLNGGAAVLVNHDPNDQIGVVESARIDADGKGRAVIRFSRSERGREIQQDVQDGIRQLVSVGYRIHAYDALERDNDVDLIRVTDWEPFELSIVSIPADVSVGVGRSADPNPSQPAQPEEPDMSEAIDVRDEAQEPAAPQPAIDYKAKLQTEEAKRKDSIKAIGDEYRVSELAQQGISEGWSVDQMYSKALEAVGERNSRAKAVSRGKGDVDLSSKEQQRFSLFRLMEAMANPSDRKSREAAGFELEVCTEAARSFGPDFQPRGEFIPETALRTLSAGTATDGAELVATNLLAGSFVEVLRNSMATARAGITMIPGLVGNVDIPRQTSGAAATWISAEDGDSTASDPQFDVISMSPKDLSVNTMATRRLTQQSTPAVEGLIRRDLAQAIALGIDKAVLYGTGLTGQPKGIANQTGINTLDLAAADPTFAELVQMKRKIMDGNSRTDRLAWMMSPAGWEALMTTPRQGSGVEGNFIIGTEASTLMGHPFFVSNQITTEEYFLGDFSDVLLGEWGGLELTVDPYTYSLKGRTLFVVFKTVDIQVRYPTSFCYAHDGIVA